MSTLLDITNKVLSYGFSSARYLDDVQDWINEAQSYIVRQANIPTANVTHSFSVTEGDNSYTLPSDFARIIDVYIEDEEDVLEEIALNEFDGLDPDDEGTPIVYIVIGSTMYFAPTPDNSYTIKMRYYKLPTTMGATDTPSIPEQYEYLLESYALHKAFRRESDFEASQFYRNQFFEDLARLKGELHRNTRAVPSQVKGTWHGFPPYYE